MNRSNIKWYLGGMLAICLLVQAADVTVSIVVSDTGGNAQALVNDFATAMGWTATIPDGVGGTIANPQTRSQYAKSKIELHIREVVKAYRSHKKAEDARAAELSAADSLIIFK